MKYYLHDSNSFNDEKITELYINFGFEGLGLFYTILEKLALQEKPVKTDVLKHQLNIGKKLDKCWNFLEQIGLISSNNGETFNKQLLTFAGKYKIKKEKNAKRISDWRNNQVDTKNVTHYEQVCNTPKVNRSKVNRSKENNTIIEKTWRNDFEHYKDNLRQGYKDFINDKEAIKLLISRYKFIDIKKSLDAVCTDYWATDEGYKNKKKTKSLTIDWRATFINSFKNSFNRINFTKEQIQQFEKEAENE